GMRRAFAVAMTSHSPLLASTLVLSAAFALACTPGTEQSSVTDGSTNTETTSAPPGNTETEPTTAPGDTETTAAPGDTETTGVPPGDTETTMETGDTETTTITGDPDTGDEACAERDPAVKDFSFVINFNEWPVMGNPNDDLVGTWIALS